MEIHIWLGFMSLTFRWPLANRKSVPRRRRPSESQ
jgi:hypothetical protein